VGMGHRMNHYPAQLSGGQQQRVAVASAISGSPSVLLADEPTGNLDSRTSIEVMGVFQGLNEQGITIVMVTHELDIASYAKRKIVMRDGLIRSDEPVAHRLHAAGEIAKLEAEQRAVQLH
jgi:putative ABC transport system ATP-binding protein